ncbi:MAG: acyl carrier protein [Gammaproteobacteria bacterium]|nr:acyl carrier protein [Gammaproteobacteria bacterium]
MKNRDEIFDEIVNILAKEFDIERASITLNATLYDELELDSIDTIDLVLRLQELTGTKIEPETFKSVKTIRDVLDATEQLINSNESIH